MEAKRQLPCSVCYLRLSCTGSQDRTPPPPPVVPAKQKGHLLENFLTGIFFFGGFIGIPFTIGFLVTRVTNAPANFEIFKPTPLVLVSPSPSPSPAPVLTTGSKNGLATK